MTSLQQPKTRILAQCLVIALGIFALVIVFQDWLSISFWQSLTSTNILVICLTCGLCLVIYGLVIAIAILLNRIEKMNKKSFSASTECNEGKKNNG